MEEARRTLLILSIVVFLVLLGISIITPSLPLYGESLGASDFLVGLIVGAYAGARVVMDIPAGFLGDRRGHKPTMTLGLLLIGFSSLGAGLAFNVWVLMAVRVIEGVGSALYTTSSVAVLAIGSPADRRGRYMSTYTGALLLGAVVGPAVGGWAAGFDLRWPFYLYAICAFVGLVLQYLFLPKGGLGTLRRTYGPAAPRRWLQLMTPSFLLVNLGVMGAFFARGAFFTIFPLFALAKFGWDTVLVGLLFTVSAFASLVAIFPSGRWADRRGRKLPFTLGLVASGLLINLFYLAADLPQQTMAMVIFGFGAGLTGPMAAWAADLAPREQLGAAMGVFRMLGDIGWLLGPVVAGGLAEVAGRTSPWPFLIPGLVALAVAAPLLAAEDPVGAQRRSPSAPVAVGPGTNLGEAPGGSRPPAR